MRLHRRGSLFQAVVSLWGGAEGYQKGFKTSDISDTLGIEPTQSSEGLHPYPSADPSVFPYVLLNEAGSCRGLCCLEMSQIPHRVAPSLAAVRWGLDYKQLHADMALEE